GAPARRRVPQDRRAREASRRAHLRPERLRLATRKDTERAGERKTRQTERLTQGGGRAADVERAARNPEQPPAAERPHAGRPGGAIQEQAERGVGCSGNRSRWLTPALSAAAEQQRLSRRSRGLVLRARRQGQAPRRHRLQPESDAPPGGLRAR